MAIYRISILRDEDGRLVATFPALPGCLTHASTLDELLRRAQEAAEGWIESAVAHGEPVPAGDGEAAPAAIAVVVPPAAA
jgi:predicted RNase H-like HicB family nuclease